MEPSLHILNQTYRGGELVQKLRTSWPYRFARTPAERAVCSAAAILRWMKIVTEETIEVDTTDVPNPPNELVSLSLAEFPIDTDSSTGRAIAKVIANCAHSFGENVFDIFDSALMIKDVWCRGQHLLFRGVLEKSNGMIRLYEYSDEQNAKDSLVHLENPFELAAAVQGKLGQRYSTETMADQYYFANPPDFIRVYWNNSSPVTHEGSTSIFDALQAFEMPYKEPYRSPIASDRTEFRDMSTSYRLVAVTRIPQPGEVAVADHLYHCDGHNFVPSFGEDRSQDWSCQEPGRYYMVYRCSEKARCRLPNGRPAPERAIPLPAGVSESLARWVDRDFKGWDSVQPPAPVPNPSIPPQDVGSVQPTAPVLNPFHGLQDVRSVQPPAPDSDYFGFLKHMKPKSDFLKHSRPVQNPTSNSDYFGFLKHVKPKAPVPNHANAGSGTLPQLSRTPGNLEARESAQPPNPQKRPFDGAHDSRPAPHGANPFENNPLATHGALGTGTGTGTPHSYQPVRSGSYPGRAPSSRFGFMASSGQGQTNTQGFLTGSESTPIRRDDAYEDDPEEN